MKKILLSLLMLCSITAAWAQNSDDLVIVMNAQDLKNAIQQNNSANIKLEANIDLSDISAPICDTFRGHIYGKYIYTNTVGEVRDTAYTITGGEMSNMFTQLDHAHIEHVQLKGISIKGTNDNVGAMAKTASYTMFNNVLMDDVSVSSTNDNAGGLVGVADHCYFETIRMASSNVKADGVGAGGLVGKSNDCHFTNVMNNMVCTVFADGRYFITNFAKAGGFSGDSTRDVFTNCANLGIIAGNEDSVGGMVGYCEGSTFTLCANSGFVVHANEDSFNTLVGNVKTELAKLATSDEGIAAIYAGLATAGSMAAGIGMGLLICGTGNCTWEFLSVTSLIVGVPIVAAVAAVIAAAAFAAWEAQQHDEIGGICGYAYGGTFDECRNSGFLRCKDSQGGGIVGRARGVVINNCINKRSGTWGDSDCAGIVGSAKDKCKVTNCLSWHSDAVFGVTSNMDPASGNNYSMDGGKDGEDWEYMVEQSEMRSGIVAYWLNNGIENRSTGKTPWSQNIGEDEFPVLNEGHNIVTRDMFEYTEIGSAKELIKFSKDVMAYPKRNAKLVADIDMTGEEWIPIGKDQDNPYRGIFDGQGHTVKGIKYSSNDPVGLFGYVLGLTEIRNVTIGDDCEFTCTGDEGAGGIVGRVHERFRFGDVIIENCGSYAKVESHLNCGGIIGRVSTDSNGDGVRVYVNNCFSMGNVISVGSSGLLCGYMKYTGVVSNCWSGGQHYGPESRYKFVGYSDKLSLTNCYVFDPLNVPSSDAVQSGVVLLGSDSYASGELAYKLNQGCGENIWQQVIGVDAAPAFGTDGVYHSRTISDSSKGYGTVCLPFALESNDEITYYRFVESKDENDDIVLSFEYVPTVEAGKPALFRTSKRGELAFYGVGEDWENSPYIDANSDIQWGIAGTYTQQVFDETTSPSSNFLYYISGGEIRNASKVTIAPFRAYLLGPSITSLKGSNNQAKALRLVLEDENGDIDAIELIENDLVPVQQNGKVYTIMGTEANKNYRGIVIKNGKKILKK